MSCAAFWTGEAMSSHSIRRWFGRATLVYAALINTVLGFLFLLEPTRATKYGFVFEDIAAGYGYVRTTTASMFLGIAVTAIYGLVRPARFLACLWFVVVMNAAIVFTRIYGIAIDCYSPITIVELRDEGLSWLVFVAALILAPRAPRPAS